MSESAYQKLHARFREAALFRSTAGVLGWDQETFLPPAGVAWRAEQLASLSGHCHRLTTAPEIGGWLDEAAGTTTASTSSSRISSVMPRE